ILPPAAPGPLLPVPTPPACEVELTAPPSADIRPFNEIAARGAVIVTVPYAPPLPTALVSAVVPAPPGGTTGKTARPILPPAPPIAPFPPLPAFTSPTALPPDAVIPASVNDPELAALLIVTVPPMPASPGLYTFPPAPPNAVVPLPPPPAF